MANNLTTNPMFLDTFTGDVTIGSKNVKILSIIITAYSSNKTVTFIDSNGVEVWRTEVAAGQSITWEPARSFIFRDGFIFDESESDLAAGDRIFVFTGTV
jgi:outer membrane protein assembly factor BamB